jgi:hypothetical protein
MVHLFELSLSSQVSWAIRHRLLHVRICFLRERCACCVGDTNWRICMNWIRAIVGVLVLWSSTAWGATLMWNANNESDLAGYRVYHCSQQPCTRTSGMASSLATLGKTTSFNIGTPTVTQYYFITAYDLSNHESGASNLATFIPAGSAPPPPPAAPPTPGGLYINSVS